MVGDRPVGKAEFAHGFGDFLEASGGRRSRWSDCAASLSGRSTRSAAAAVPFPPARIRPCLRASPAGYSAGRASRKSPPRSGTARAVSGRAFPPSNGTGRIRSAAGRARMARWRMTMLCSLLPVKYISAKGNSASLTTRRSDWMPPSSSTLALVSPLARTFRMPGWLVKKSMTSAGFFDEASKSMSPMTSLPPQAAGRAAADHVGMRAQTLRAAARPRAARR